MAISLWSAGAAAGAAMAPDVSDPVVVEAFVDGAVRQAMQDLHASAGVVAVMKGGKVILQKGYGYQDIDRRIPVNGRDSLFRAGSISKLFTWIAVMQLVEQGRLSLDADVNTYLRTFVIPDTFPGQPVTLRHIMTHTAGFEDGALGYLILDDPAGIRPLAASLARYQPRRVTPPGERAAYSNWASALAGLIVANVSGMTFSDYVQRNIFDALGMAHASFREPLPPELDKLMTRAYALRAGRYVEKPFEIISNFAPAGAVSVSAHDMTLFARALLNEGSWEGRRILRPETLQQMLDEGYVKDPRLRGVGLGFLKREFGPDGFNSFGHDGNTFAFSSHFYLSKAEDFMLFSSFAGPGGRQVSKHFVSAFYSYFYRRPVSLIESPIEPPQELAARARAYAGVYHSSRSNYSTLESILRSMGGTEVMTSPDGALLIDGERYVEVGRNLFREERGPERIAFQADGAGGIAGFVRDGDGVVEYYRAPFPDTWRFNMMVMGCLVLVASLVLVRAAYRCWRHRSPGLAEQRVEWVSLAVAVCALCFFLWAGLGVRGGVSAMLYGYPLAIKLALFFPLLLVPLVLCHCYLSIRVWQSGLLASGWARLWHTMVSLTGLLGLWFFQHWNLIGFNYFT
ncbi:serine hydrolase domain-containing protein [Parahaliea mediterranea]|uniref:serine hydrolase domain-containing protein n=1 Tax=Parahaliea mediterranea TaxID=651086 RepID=UPI0013005F60|nr:serine hydrolase domain-containing protein [Parahaliea mediterranea]